MFYPKYRLGLILAILSPFYFEFIRHHVKKYSWLMLLLVLYIYVIILSGNKSSWVMLVISIFLYTIYLYFSGYLSKLKKSQIIIALVICFIGAAVLNNAARNVPQGRSTWVVSMNDRAAWIEDRMHSMVSLLSGDIENAGATFQHRIMIWEGAIG